MSDDPLPADLIPLAGTLPDLPPSEVRGAVELRHASAVVHRAPDGEALRDALALSELLTGMAQVTHDLQQRIEAITGLRFGQLRALQAVATGAVTFSEVGRRIAEHRDAARATVRSLVHLGFVSEAPGGIGGRATLATTEAGRAQLDQIEALRVRLLAQLPPGVSDPLLALADGLASNAIGPGSRLP